MRPPYAGRVYPDPKSLIAKASNQANSNPLELTIRSLLAYWGAKRRGYWIVGEIDRDLIEAGLTTFPPFTEGWIDNLVRIVPYKPSEPASTLAPTNRTPAAAVAADSLATMHVGSLPSANKGITSVPPDASLALAQSLMLRFDYSQLAVVSGDRNVRGAVSWESIAQARLRDSNCPLRDAITPAELVDLDHDLLALIPAIVDKGFVFVLTTDRRIGGIITMADLSLEFANLAKPFFSIGEIERRLRRTIDDCFERPELEAVRAPGDEGREIRSAQDLAFGEYGRLLEEPKRWAKLDWPIDRVTFTAALNEVRSVRNEVMHFSPDPLDDDQVVTLTNFIKWLRTLDPRP